MECTDDNFSFLIVYLYYLSVSGLSTIYKFPPSISISAHCLCIPQFTLSFLYNLSNYFAPYLSRWPSWQFPLLFTFKYLFWYSFNR